MEIFLKDNELQEIVNSKNSLYIIEASDESCLNDHDDSFEATDIETFSMGFELGQKAAKMNKPVYQFDIDDGDSSVFFIGTREEVLERLNKCDDDDWDDSNCDWDENEREP
jgi:hypothetical protein